jgi:hypothetical protein
MPTLVERGVYRPPLAERCDKFCLKGEERTDENAVDGGLLCLGDLGVARDELGVAVGPLSGLPALQSSTSCQTCGHVDLFRRWYLCIS